MQQLPMLPRMPRRLLAVPDSGRARSHLLVVLLAGAKVTEGN